MKVTDAIDAKLATRQTYDSAKATVDLLSAITDDETSIPFRIQEILAVAQETLRLATEADQVVYARLIEVLPHSGTDYVQHRP
jgi:hypothetical protein